MINSDIYRLPSSFALYVFPFTFRWFRSRYTTDIDKATAVPVSWDFLRFMQYLLVSS